MLHKKRGPPSKELRGMNEPAMRRLAFIRYLYSIGAQQSQRPEPYAAASVLTFHDSVELFLQLACEFHDVKTKGDPDFMEYWTLLDPKLSKPLGQKESMRRLNRARVGLKHQGIIPYSETEGGFSPSVTSFFQENTPLVFEGIKFDEISMVDIVQSKRARSKLKEASTMMREGAFEDALTSIALAFAQLIDDYENGKRHGGRSPFFFGESLAFESSSTLDLGGTKLERFVDKVRDSVEALQEAMRILSLGVDYRQYTRFRLYTPVVLRMLGGAYHVQWIMQEKATEEECRFCFDFVIDTAVRLQEYDYEVSDEKQKERRERVRT